jgi:Tfp pilus assembly protein PilX
MVRNRQRGAVLINVMILMFFLGALGFAATSMARGNAQTTVSDIRYQQAEWAAE